jgi:hypothetical protein
MIYNIEDVVQSSERHKLYYLVCPNSSIDMITQELEQTGIKSINVGKTLAFFIDNLEDSSYLNIDVFDYFKNILDEQKAKINNIGNEVVAVYNLGILLEPSIELKATQLLKNFSKAAALIIIWENQSDIPDRLHWLTQHNNIFLDFTETPLKKLQYAI